MPSICSIIESEGGDKWGDVQVDADAEARAEQDAEALLAELETLIRPQSFR